MFSSDEEDIQNIPPDIAEAATAATMDLLPEKSQAKYLKTYSAFKQWCSQRKVNEVNETVLLAYFYELSKVLKPPSLWSKYSMLKCTLAVKENIDIKYPKLIAFLKRQNTGYRAKKSETFTREDLNKFLLEAPDDEYLIMKLALVIGVSGACRCDELAKMNIGDIEVKDRILIIKIPDSKTRIQRTFVVNGDTCNGVDIMEMYEKYVALRPPHTPHQRFFINYRARKCTIQVIGKNTLSKIPFKVAKFLAKPNASAFSGHCLRRTSATLLVDAGANILSLKRHGGWKSTSVAEGYVAESVVNKVQASNRIMEGNKVVCQKPEVASSTCIDPEIAPNCELLLNKKTKLNCCSNVTIQSPKNCTFYINTNNK